MQAQSSTTRDRQTSIERTQHFSRCGRIIVSDVVVNGVEIGKLHERARSAPALGPRTAGASCQPTTTTPDNVVDIDFTGRSGVETLLDFRLQPGKLLAATLLMQDRCDDCGFAAAIRALAHLRRHEFFESGWKF
jgi:hypothetical protein